MDEVCTRIISHAAKLQLESRLPDFPGTDAGNEKVNCLSFDMQAVPGGATASFDQKRIVRRRTIAGDYMDLSRAAKGLLHEIEVLNDAGIHRGNFSRVMTTENVIDVVQRRQIVLSAFVTIPQAQPLIGVDIVK